MDRIITGDCRDLMAAMDAASVDAIVTDPPYGLEFMGKKWDKLGDVSHGKVAFGPTRPRHTPRTPRTIRRQRPLTPDGSDGRNGRRCLTDSAHPRGNPRRGGVNWTEHAPRVTLVTHDPRFPVRVRAVSRYAV